MRAVVQRVKQGQVRVEGEVVSAIAHGYVILLGVSKEDTPAAVDYLAEKVAFLRVFEDDAGKMNRSIIEAGGSALAVSQFTLYGDVRRGRRPAFDQAAGSSLALPLYERFVAKLRGYGISVETGRFGAHMEVELINDGPVTILLDSDRTF